MASISGKSGPVYFAVAPPLLLPNAQEERPGVLTAERSRDNTIDPSLDRTIGDLRIQTVEVIVLHERDAVGILKNQIGIESRAVVLNGVSLVGLHVDREDLAQAVAFARIV